MTISPDWAQAIDDYLAAQRVGGYPVTTQNTRRQHLQHLARRIGVEPWEVTADQLVNWSAEQEWAASTRHHRRVTFRSFYKWAKRTGRRKGDPSRALTKVRQTRANPRPVPQRIYLEALMRADEDERVMLELAYDHGMRRGEIAVSHSDDLIEDLVPTEEGRPGYSMVVHGKGSKDRVVPLTPAMARTLLDRGPGYFFTGEIDGHISDRWLGKRVNTLLEGKWTIHTLRHSAGTRWNAKGGLLVAQELLGHASVATTQIYCKVPDQEAARVLRATAS